MNTKFSNSEIEEKWEKLNRNNNSLPRNLRPPQTDALRSILAGKHVVLCVGTGTMSVSVSYCGQIVVKFHVFQKLLIFFMVFNRILLYNYHRWGENIGRAVLHTAFSRSWVIKIARNVSKAIFSAKDSVLFIAPLTAIEAQCEEVIQGY